MISEILNALAEFFQLFFSMFSSKEQGPQILPSNILRVFIKHNAVVVRGGNNSPSSSSVSPSAAVGSQTVAVDLDIHWSIKQVKEIIAPKLKLTADEIKIIFAGKELPDDLVLESCNVGQQSFLHAVKIQINSDIGANRSRSTSDDNTNEKNKEIDEQEETIPSETDNNPNVNQLVGRASHGEGCLSHHRQSTLSESGAHEFPLLVNTNNAPGQVDANIQSEFFVYCETCGGLREGKLRVRCAVCMSGAFTVLRDPEDWTDVLRPNQVPGSCETVECPSNYSQFYFKCKSHITSGEDDSSCPLPQVKHNPDKIPCLACGDSKDPVFVFSCPTKHVTCIECFQHYALVKTNQRQFTLDSTVGYTLGCPALCENSLVEDGHHFKLLGKYQYDRYQRFGAEECVLQNGGVLCPQPNCGMGIFPTEEGCNKVACMHGCGFVFCRICLEGWHVGECSRDSSVSFATGSSAGSSSSYPVAYERVAKAQWDDDTRRALRLSTKPCPKCRVATERAGGCMHMECPKCAFQWCWVCQNKWTRDCMGNHWFG